MVLHIQVSKNLIPDIFNSKLGTCGTNQSSDIDWWQWGSIVNQVRLLLLAI